MARMAINDEGNESDGDRNTISHKRSLKGVDSFKRLHEKDDGLYLRVFFAFALGFVQTMMGFTLELMSVLYLSSWDSFRMILISYATMACLGNFDTLYAQSLQEHPIRNVIGKNFCTVYRRSMYFYKEQILKCCEHE